MRIDFRELDKQVQRSIETVDFNANNPDRIPLSHSFNYVESKANWDNPWDVHKRTSTEGVTFKNTWVTIRSPYSGTKYDVFFDLENFMYQAMIVNYQDKRNIKKFITS